MGKGSIPGSRSSSRRVLLSPLEVRFSQNVIFPRFNDGRELESAVLEACKMRKGC